jgi:hypothetical protein
MSCGHTKFEGSPPCPCDWESVSLVDYGVLKERARIRALLAKEFGAWSEAVALVEGVDDE